MTTPGDSEAATIPHPALWGVLYRSSTPFWDAVGRRELCLQRCADCETWLMPPRPMCPNCQSAESEWVPVSGRGKVHSWVTYQASPHPAFEAPYSVILVELDEGPRLVSNPAGITPEELEIDMPVELVFEDVSDDFAVYKFKRAG